MAAVDDRESATLFFAALLRRYREELGHRNAHSFFEAQGGRPFFGCTYRAYVNVERGKAVPRPALVEKLIAALRVALEEGKAREFARAYLRMLLGLGDFYDFVADGLAGEADRKSRAYDFDDRITVLEPGQARLLYASEVCYWCFTALSNDTGRWRAPELAAAIGFPAEAVAAALARLERARLAARDEGGRWHCSFQGKLLFEPKDRPYRPRDLAALRSHWDRMALRRGGEVIQEHPVMTRASETELGGYFPYLMHALLAAERFSVKEKGPDTGFFLLELSAERLLPF